MLFEFKQPLAGKGGLYYQLKQMAVAQCVCLRFIFREMEAKGGLTYESADRSVQQLSHDALPPPLSLQSLQAGNQTNK